MLVQISGERIKTEKELFIENFNKMLRDNADDFTEKERAEIDILDSINESSLVKFNDYVKEGWKEFFDCIIDESYTLSNIMFVVIEKYMLDYQDCIKETTNDYGIESIMQGLKEEIARCELEESLKKQSTIRVGVIGNGFIPAEIFRAAQAAESSNDVCIELEELRKNTSQKMVKMPIGLFPAGIVQCLKEIEKENQKEECAVQKEVDQLCVSEIINEIVSAMSDIGVKVKVPGQEVKKEEEVVRCKVPAWALSNSESIQSFYEKLMSLK